MRSKAAPVLVVSLGLAATLLTAGCGGSDPTPATLVSPGVPLATTASSAAGSPRSSAATSAASSPPPSKNVVGTVDFSFSTGDQVELTFAVDPLTDLTSADPIAQSCRLDADDSRALVRHVVVISKLTSSLAQKFSLEFGTSVPLAAQLAGGGRCLYPGPDSGLTLTLNPGQSNTQDLWMIADGAKSPTYPAGDPTILQRMVFDPSMHVGWTVGQPDAVVEAAFGSGVLVCNLELASHIQAEIFADPASFARGDSNCAPVADKAAFKALEQQAGTVGTTGS